MAIARPLTVHWHDDRKPIYDVSFQPDSAAPNRSARFATAGGDTHIRLWRLKFGPDPSETPEVEYLSTLAEHTAAVNCVAFDRSGQLLASAGDDGVVRFWAPGVDPAQPEAWRLLRLGRLSPPGEVYALSWAPTGLFLAACMLNKQVSIVNTQTGKVSCVLSDHRHYVQGVAWDPLDEFVATQSSDQRALVYSLKDSATKGECVLVGRIERTEKIQFHNENFPSFFRRLCFSPDGSLLVVLAGVHDDNTECALLYTRGSLRGRPQPAAVLPLPKPGIGASFCPVVFELNVNKTEDASKPLVLLPYRLVYAVATTTSVFVYATDLQTPLFMAANLHYAPITGLEWSPDGRVLLLTSIDGFCSVIKFENNEIGVPVVPQPRFGPGSEVQAQKPSTQINTLVARRKT